VAGGGSAGGHVAAATATVEGFNEEGEDTAVSCVANALVLFNPVFNNGPGEWGHGVVEEYWKDISPAHNISEKTPPTIVFLGSKDPLIPVAVAEDFQRQMKAQGLRSDLHIYEGQPHGFFNTARYYETVVEADKFLTSLGYLKGKPTLEKK
jgi:acetyl esterase/lipase